MCVRMLYTIHTFAPKTPLAFTTSIVGERAAGNCQEKKMGLAVRFRTHTLEKLDLDGQGCRRLVLHDELEQGGGPVEGINQRISGTKFHAAVLN